MKKESDSVIDEITEKNISDIIKKRNPSTHKGDYGYALIIAGSFGKIGAAVLASKACLRSGVGLLSVYIPTCGYNILQSTIPEAMVVCDVHEKIIASGFNVSQFDSVCIGPGIGTNTETANAIKEILASSEKPMVIDADAINILAVNKSWLSYVPLKSIFTPHYKEFERLVGKTNSSDEAIAKQIEFSKMYNVFVILKGHNTTISFPNGSCYMNTTGNAGMAKAGSGDSLSGILTALLAQGYLPEQASIAGVYLHGLAGDIAANETGEYSLLATDLIDNIGNAFLKILSI